MNACENLKKWYFEIKDYQSTGVKKHSWIGTYRVYYLSKEKIEKIRHIKTDSEESVFLLTRKFNILKYEV